MVKATVTDEDVTGVTGAALSGPLLDRLNLVGVADARGLRPKRSADKPGMSSMIRNYLGFPRGISGMRLAQRARMQALWFGAEFIVGWDVTGLTLADGEAPHLVHTDGGDVRARPVVIATGAAYRKLNVAGIDPLTGSGVFYGSAMSTTREMDRADVVVAAAATPPARPHRTSRSSHARSPSSSAATCGSRRCRNTSSTRSPPTTASTSTRVARSSTAVAQHGSNGSSFATQSPARPPAATGAACSCCSAPSRAVNGSRQVSRATPAASCSLAATSPKNHGPTGFLPKASPLPYPTCSPSATPAPAR